MAVGPCSAGFGLEADAVTGVRRRGVFCQSALHVSTGDSGTRSARHHRRGGAVESARSEHATPVSFRLKLFFTTPLIFTAAEFWQ